ncbi:MAG: organic hydroperoxide reductase OsmC/OhrA [Cyclobacteriaceae bacterium]|jgi:organic hydroperoxide reductase OsmC/OhrA
MMEAHYYNVDVNWNNDRKGIMCSPELNLSKRNGEGCIEVATPPKFPKGIPGIWSPEHLFTASVNSCLMTTFLAIAESSKLQLQGKREIRSSGWKIFDDRNYPRTNSGAIT